ncbi:hypothetical protein ACFL45_05060 [Candidatus Neomarinimicrobiota bacterium]
MAESAIAKKLRLKDDQRALFLHAPEGYLKQLGPAGKGADTVPYPDVEYDFVQLFVRDGEELEQCLATALAAVTFDGLLWICYLKQSSGVKTDLNRDILRKLMEPTGWRPVSQVALDEVWSAVRFRPEQQVGK